MGRLLENCSTLAECEAALSVAFRQVQLVGELPLTDEDLSKLSQLVAQWARRYAPVRRLGQQMPAVLVTLMVWAGIEGYYQGDYWSSLSQLIPWFDPARQAVWGKNFLLALSRLGLRPFDVEGALPYVTPILGHAMIPNSCLPEFFQYVVLPMVARDRHLPVTPGEIQHDLETWREWAALRTRLELEGKRIDKETELLGKRRRSIEAVRARKKELAAQVEQLRRAIQTAETDQAPLSLVDQRLLAGQPDFRSLLAGADPAGLRGCIVEFARAEHQLTREISVLAAPILDEPWNERCAGVLATVEPGMLLERWMALQHARQECDLISGRQATLVPSQAEAPPWRRWLGRVLLWGGGMALVATSQTWLMVPGAVCLLAGAKWEWDVLQCRNQDRRRRSDLDDTLANARISVAIERDRLLQLLSGLSLSPRWESDPHFPENLLNLTERVRSRLALQEELKEATDQYRTKATAIRTLAEHLGIPVADQPEETLADLLRQQEAAALRQERLHARDRERAQQMKALQELEQQLSQCPDEAELDAESRELDAQLRAAHSEQEYILAELYHTPHPIPQQVSEPVRRFLLYGGTTAEQFLLAAVLRVQDLLGVSEALPVAGLPERAEAALADWFLTIYRADRYREPGAGRDALREPRLAWDPIAQAVFTVMPNQVFSPGRVTNDLTFALSTSRGQQREETVPVFRTTGGQVEAQSIQVAVPGPAQEYTVSLRSGPTPLGQWQLPGLTGDRPFLAFSTTGAWEEDGPLRRRPLWLVLSPSWSPVLPEEAILESGPLYGAWAGHSYIQADLGQVDELILTGPSDRWVQVHLHQVSAPEVRLEGGTVLTHVQSSGHPLYTGQPPALWLPVEPEESPSLWRISLFPAPGSYPSQERHVRLTEVAPVPPSETGQGLVALNHPRLLGEAPAGRFRLRVRGANRLDQWVELAVFPTLAVGFGERLYWPVRRADLTTGTDVQVTLDLPPRFEFTSLTPVQPIRAEGTRRVLAYAPDTDAIQGLLTDAGSPGEHQIVLPIEVSVPRVQWQILGQGVRAYSEWQNWVAELQLRDWEQPDHLELGVRFPPLVQAPDYLVLQGSGQQAPARIRQGNAWFDLRRFLDSLRHGPPVRNFELAMGESAPELLFQVRTRWGLTHLTCEQSVASGERTLVVAWQDEGISGERVVRLWSLDRPQQPILWVAVGQGTNHAQLTAPVPEIPAGTYLIQVADDDPWDTTKPVCPPPDTPNTLLLVLEHEGPSPGPIPTSELEIDAVLVPESKVPLGFNLYRYLLSLYPQREFLGPNVYMGRVTIIPRGRGRTEVYWEDSVEVEYDEEQGVLGYITDKDGDGALYCLSCLRLFWSGRVEEEEARLGHLDNSRGRVVMPERFLLKPRRGNPVC